MALRSFVSACLLLLLSRASSAQGVRGTVVEGGTLTPLSGVVVLLVDSAGNTVARALTDEGGAFRLGTVGAGTYRVRTLRIGYRPSTSAPIVLAAGQEVVQPAFFAGAPVLLDTVRVRGRSACQVRNDDSAAATFAVWEQIRTALTAAQLSATHRNLSATVVTHQRSLDADGRRVLQQYSRISSGITARPWRSVSPDSLRRTGYAVTEIDESTTYFAPDLDVLVSDGFAEDHCFRLVSETGRLGIAFEPTRARRQLPEIRGTLWLDRASSELRRLEFGYVNLPREQESAAGAELEFLRLPQGAWLISHWSIRVPVIETRYAEAAGYTGVRRVVGRSVRGIKVDGGDLALVTRRRDTLWARPPLTLAGVVRDSASDAGVFAARVTLRGTALVARTDSTGRFRIAGVLPGEYLLDIDTPSLEAIGVTRSMPMAFTDSAGEFIARVPSADHVVESVCTEKPVGMVAGRVTMQGDSAPARNATVIVEWNVFAWVASEIQSRVRWVDTTTDARGRFRLCGVPRNTALTVRAQSDAGAATLGARIALEAAFTQAELVLTPAGGRAAAFSGVVLSDVNGQPIADVELALPSLAKNVYTNENGDFRISEIPPGTHQLVVRRLGYRQLNAALTFEANRNVERRFLLSRIVALDTITVTARNLPEFERNREMGLGHFLTRQDIQKQEERELADIVAQLPGVLVRRNGSRGYIASLRGMGTSIATESNRCPKLRFEFRAPTPPCACYAQVYVDEALLYGGLEGETIPDINTIPTSSIAAIEYYAGPAQTPVRYSRLNAQCGVLVIHTRRSPL